MDSVIIQGVTLAIAVLGALLGVMNTWRNWSLDRMRLRVTPAFGLDNTGGRNILVTVVNLSSFPVTVTTMGFTLLNSTNHMQVPAPIFMRGERLPIRLEPRTSCTAVVALAALEHAQLANIRCAYVTTACGQQIEGDSTALRQMVHAAATAQQ